MEKEKIIGICDFCEKESDDLESVYMGRNIAGFVACPECREKYDKK